MGQRTKGDMWCELCGRPVLGLKTTARARNTALTALLPVTMGASALGYKNERYVCQDCGSPVVHIPGLARRYAAEVADADRYAAELPMARPADAPVDYPAWQPGTLDPQPELAQQLAQLSELHASGALSDEEFARAKARVLED